MRGNDFVGIVGAGTMGSDIAQVAALADKTVVAVDVSPESLKRAERTICDSLDRMVSKGTLAGDAATAAMSRIRFSTEYAALERADVVVEAATESLQLKRTILQQLSNLVPEQTLLATNTSSLSVTMLAAGIRYPARFIGIHFFNPVRAMPLVEIVRGVATAESTCDRAIEFVKDLGKTPISVRNSPGFVVNRLLVPMINEAFFLLGEGIASAGEIDQAMKLGANHPLGPLALADLIGLDVCLAVMDVLLREFGDGKYRAAPMLRELVAAGRLGKKSGQGVFAYGSDAAAPATAKLNLPPRA